MRTHFIDPRHAAASRHGVAVGLVMLLCGCGDGHRGTGDSLRISPRTANIQETQGQQTQGQQTQGSDLDQGDGDTWIHRTEPLPGNTEDNAWFVRRDSKVKVRQMEVYQGELRILQGPTPSLASCAPPFSEPADVLNRSCGWGRGGIGSCQPGATVTVTFPSCAAGVLGAHGTMVRVCQDLDTCEAATAIGQAAVACDATKPLATATATFSCPSSGWFNLMKGISGTSSPPEAIAALSSSSGPLQEALTGPDLVGLYLSGQENGNDESDGGVFRITEVGTRAKVPATGYYVVQKQKKGVADEWEPLCRPATIADPDVSAIALAGSWTRIGDWKDERDIFTFACRRGVLAKCYEWGYMPWQPGRRVYHQTCTRAARADMCGTGNAHTVDGTLIDIEDVPISTTDSRSLHSVNTICTTQKTQGPQETACSLDPGLFSLESVWAVDTRGATQDACGETRFPPKILCLSKKRWETIPLGGYCPDTLVDPRVNDCRNDPKYTTYYCNGSQTTRVSTHSTSPGGHCKCKHCTCKNCKCKKCNPQHGNCNHDKKCDPRHGNCNHDKHCDCKHCQHDGEGSGDPCTDSSVILSVLADTERQCGVYCDDIIPNADGVSTISGMDSDMLAELRSQLETLNQSPELYNNRQGLFIVYSTPVDTTLAEIVDSTGERYALSGTCTVAGDTCAQPPPGYIRRTVLGAAYRANILNASSLIPLFSYQGTGATAADRMMTAWYKPSTDSTDPCAESSSSLGCYWSKFQQSNPYQTTAVEPAGWIFSPAIPRDRLPQTAVPLHQCVLQREGWVDHILATPASASLPAVPDPTKTAETLGGAETQGAFNASASSNCPPGYEDLGLEGYLPYGPSPSQLESAEICNGVDDNGDGQTDNRDLQEHPLTVPCTSRGCCKGIRTCTNGRYGECVGPQEECNGVDDDCDGVVDNLGSGPLTQPCTAACGGVGTQVCAGGHWGACSAGPVRPEPAGPHLSGNYTISDAASVAALTSYTAISGDLVIAPNSTAGSVALPHLVRVDGSVRVEGTPITSLSLPKLESVNGSLQVRENASLTSVELGQLGSICGQVHLYRNPTLATVGSQGLITVGNSFDVDGNAALESLLLPSLDSVGGHLRLYNDRALERFDAHNLQRVGGNVSVYNAPLSSLDIGNLTRIPGNLELFATGIADVNLGRLTELGGRFYLVYNGNLTNIGPIPLTAIGREIHLDNNAALESFALPDLDSVGSYIFLTNNTALANLDVHSLRTVGGIVSIYHSPPLSALDLGQLERIPSNFKVIDTGIQSLNIARLTQLDGYFHVAFNPNLTHIGPSPLVAIGQYFHLEGSPDLHRIGLASLESIGGYLYAASTGLVSFDLPSLTTLVGDAYIERNASLPDACISALQTQITSHCQFFVSNNGGAGACLP